MEELIAKRYVKALKAQDDVNVDEIISIFDALAEAFKDSSLRTMIDNPSISKSQKADMIVASLQSAKNSHVENLIKLLAQNARLGIIPYISKVLKKDLAHSQKRYVGVVHSDTEIAQTTLDSLGAGLGKKFDSDISLEYRKDNFEGIKVSVEDLGIEISFSKTRISNQIVDHILKAI
ncbi:MAG: F0F1 ATP synthase subunit delta [Sulfuricurvum sp.]